jgi:hypothetical protein
MSPWDWPFVVCDARHRQDRSHSQRRMCTRRAIPAHMQAIATSPPGKYGHGPYQVRPWVFQRGRGWCAGNGDLKMTQWPESLRSNAERGQSSEHLPPRRPTIAPNPILAIVRMLSVSSFRAGGRSPFVVRLIATQIRVNKSVPLAAVRNTSLNLGSWWDMEKFSAKAFFDIGGLLQTLRIAEVADKVIDADSQLTTWVAKLGTQVEAIRLQRFAGKSD